MSGPRDYRPRREANEASRLTAEAFGEIWEQHEVELLEEAWSEATIEEIAETLGRTIEACRQKHYDLGRTAQRTVRTKQAKATTNSKWDRGWTSLEDMGY